MNTKDLSISPKNKKREEEIFKKICECIDRKKSMVFDAGAGSGKTYSLIQSLNYIITIYGKTLKEHNQKVLCITYTNVAAAEIKERLGNTSIVEVSTIHDCVWRIISPYQKQLIKIHQKKIRDQIKNLENDLLIERWAEKYRDLSKEQKEQLSNMMNDKKQVYYKHKNNKAAEFKGSLPEITKTFPNIISNLTNFKRIIDSIFKIQKYQETLQRILIGEKKFKKVEYDVRYNNDKLENMKISHDTLLEYTNKIIDQNDLLKQIICDLYPFILVDEYQDTDCKVVETLNFLDEYSQQIKHDIFVGYFGDIKQNIYGTGVGIKFSSYHKNLDRVEKRFNRRSAKEIITVANKIRNDDLEQETIYDDFPIGSVSFYNMNIDRQDFIKTHINKWEITKKNKLHCFELTNELAAKQSGFANIYDFFKNSSWYKRGKNYELLREHILSLDSKKLGEVQSLLFRIMDFRYKVNHDETMVQDILGKGVLQYITITRLRNLIAKLKNIKGDTLRTYIESMFNQYNKGDEEYYECLHYILDIENGSYIEIESFILNKLFLFNEQEEQTDEYIKESKDKVIKFLEMDIEEFNMWYEYISDRNTNSVIYHTYHGTKGLEFENVIIFMNAKFGRDNEYFSRLLKVMSLKDEVKQDTKIEEARNLLYVAVTRATLNLSILYFEDVSEFREQIENVFGSIKYKL
ncbi:UvrD-helicase domain-containing protein [Clostridium sp. ZS2-4]|uniref:UvrD-helicase domain-containing protein n=1 Tax=Clostridium sp. ZS2-4 TaxID=2987703 RepID=UPI00227D41DF|nr:UvrD-helicase domain-containing protein [Clostridium sp. ZS2-4]MCY6354398.1 UvrD-helicase domain-containing protein [Clostridium sp. ZS2-4]